MEKSYVIYIYSRNTRLRRDFPRPPGERRLWCPFGKPPPPAPVKEIRKKIGVPEAPQIFLFSFTAAEGAAIPEGERNPAEGGCFASIYI